MTTKIETEMTSTTVLEDELKQLSARLTNDQMRFAEVAGVLKRRRETQPDDQPAPEVMTSEQMMNAQLSAMTSKVTALATKVTEMEAEQARLVVEAEVAKADKREAEARLALVTRYYSVSNTSKQS